MVREGLKYVVPMLAAAALSAVILGHHALTYVALGLAVALAAFFRRAPAPAAVSPNAILSPAAGFVIEVVDEDEPLFMKSPARRISIFMTPLDVHVNTAPFDGSIRYTEYRPGTFFKADRAEARLQNEKMLVGFERTDGVRCLAAQVAGWLARRIVCDVCVGDNVRQGRRYGMIEFGSRMDLHMPAKFQIRVTPGQHVRAATTVLAEEVVAS